MMRNVLIINVLLLLLFQSCAPAGFDMEVRLSNSMAFSAPITDGTVQLQFGKNEPLPAEPVDKKGRAYFTGIKKEFEHDSIRVIYEPARPKRWRITEQNAYTAAENKVLQVTVDFPPETTSFMWSLRDKNEEGIVGAVITFDNKIQVTTESSGYFDITLPKPAGEKVHFHIEKEGKVLMDKDIAIYPEYRRLILDQ